MNKFIREYLQAYAYKEISAYDLVALLEKHFGNGNEILHEYIEENFFQNPDHRFIIASLWLKLSSRSF